MNGEASMSKHTFNWIADEENEPPQQLKNTTQEKVPVKKNV